MSDHVDDHLRLPAAPIDRVTAPIERFLHIEAAGGIVLLACTIVALVLANSRFAGPYLHLWETPIGVEIGPLQLRHSLEHWINDGLMAIFFFVVGLEVKRELVHGELADLRRAALPIVAALGGMLVPAGMYLGFQAGQPAARGWGIPMATDIAFVVGCMAVLGPRMPHGLRILLLSLAIADDVGAILVIALGYSSGIQVAPLGLAAAAIGVMLVLQRAGVRSLAVYGLLGVVVWLGVHASGVHATIAGVMLGLLTPASPSVSAGRFAALLDGVRTRLDHGETRQRVARLRLVRHATRETVSPLEYLEATLHPWVAFVIMPVFALANAGVPLRGESFADPVAIAVGTSLLVGKPLGIVAFTWLAVRAGVARLPDGVGWAALGGGGALAGIGFTMALFIAGLALEGTALEAAKVGILAGSAVAAAVGMALLVRALPVPARR